jgi:hypothetical protein
VTGPPAARPIQPSAERPASKTAPDVWLRDANGDGARRIPLAMADKLVQDGIVDRVSAGGHVRLKLGIRSLPNGDAIHGLPVVEISRFLYGDGATARGMKRLDSRAK